ncbi:hypothetical protein AX16_002102 [Volvariella volvacea WC 439]|nr:hypothetical protein AX16_002102 [Volvariella volvacea WC 439]
MDALFSCGGLLLFATGTIYLGSFGSLPSPPRHSGAKKTSDDQEEENIDRLTTEDAWLFPIIGSVALFGLYLAIKYFGTEWINWFLKWYFSIISVGKDKSATVNNILALSFAFNALSLLKLDSFKTGTILLSGLFLYDVWWVFGTEVMVKVATNIDGPIKILWPRSSPFSPSKGYAMLGLGDIVIPGTFVALALRYDYFRHSRISPFGTFPKPYFHSAMLAYVLGLATTMVVMNIFQAAQPALLYLSPACILSFALTGLVHGDLTSAWAWSDDPEELRQFDAKAELPSQEKAADDDHSELTDDSDDSTTKPANSTKEKSS